MKQELKERIRILLDIANSDKRDSSFGSKMRYYYRGKVTAFQHCLEIIEGMKVDPEEIFDKLEDILFTDAEVDYDEWREDDGKMKCDYSAKPSDYQRKKALEYLKEKLNV